MREINPPPSELKLLLSTVQMAQTDPPSLFSQISGENLKQNFPLLLDNFLVQITRKKEESHQTEGLLLNDPRALIAPALSTI